MTKKMTNEQKIQQLKFEINLHQVTKQTLEAWQKEALETFEAFYESRAEKIEQVKKLIKQKKEELEMLDGSGDFRYDEMRDNQI